MKWWLTVILAVVLLLAASGCGGGHEEEGGTFENELVDANGSAETVDEGQEIGDNDNAFFNFDTVLDIAGEFKELGYNFMGQKVNYSFHGEDTVNGVKAEYITVKANSAAFDIWVAPDGVILKAEADGQELPPEAAQSAHFMFGFLEIFVDEQQWDKKWADGEQSRDIRDLGAGPVDITRYEWRVPMMPVYIEVDVAEIAGRSLIVKLWQYGNDGTSVSGWELYRVIPR